MLTNETLLKVDEAYKRFTRGAKIVVENVLESEVEAIEVYLQKIRRDIFTESFENHEDGTMTLVLDAWMDYE